MSVRILLGSFLRYKCGSSGDKILTDGTKKGLHGLSDRDARPRWIASNAHYGIMEKIL